MNRISLHLARLILPLLLLPLLLACQRGDPVVDALHRTADSLMQSRADSALLLLQACDSVGVSPVSAPVDAWPRRQRMRHELLRAKAMNKAYVNFTTDSVMKEVADYYDSHGTPNERMEAHYLLGCVYRDLGEAPRALDCFNDAVSCVEKLQTGDESLEIINADCDYSQLCRIYAQKADILWHQSLLDDYLETLDKAIFYAEKANDSIVMLNSLAYKMCAYEKKNMPDSVISIHRKIHDSYLKIGKPDIAARFAFLSIGSYLMKGLYDEAEKFLDFYERESGYFEENGKIQKGREVYYYMKGKYYASIQANDSAFYWFRKELAEGSDLNNQNGASRELSLLYHKMGIADSAAKYAIYSYDMNDSAYKDLITDKIENVKGLYNYNRHQQIAVFEKDRADRGKRNTLVVLSLSLLALLAATAVLIKMRKKREMEKSRSIQLSLLLSKAQLELEKLKKLELEHQRLKSILSENDETMSEMKLHGDELERLMHEKEKEINNLRKNLATLRRHPWEINSIKSVKQTESPTYQAFWTMVRAGKEMDDSEWIKTHELIDNELPLFAAFAEMHKSKLSRMEFKVLLLLRLQLRTNEVAFLLGTQSSNVSKMSSNILRRIWKKDGSSKELSSIIASI